METNRGVGLYSLKTFLFFSVLFLCMAAFVNQGATQEQQKPSKVFQLKFGSFVPPTHHFVKNAYNPWMDMVHKESNGRIKITFYPSGALAKLFDMYDSVIRGIQDVAPIVPSFEGEKFPLTNVLETPFVVPNGRVATQLLYGPLWDKYLANEYKNLKVLGRYASTPYQLLTKKPVRNLNDLKAMKIRGSGGVQVKVIKALGATPVTTEDSELYEGMKRNTIEGFFYMYSSAVGWRLWEVVKYVTEINYSGGVGIMVMSKEVWEKLPPDLQAAIERASKDLGNMITGSYEKENDAAKEKFTSAGVQMISFPASEKEEILKRCKPVIDEWVQTREAKKLPARECYDFVRAQAKLY